VRPVHLALLLVVFACSGCLDRPFQWAKPHEEELAALDGLCRSYGNVSGSPQFERCVETETLDQYEQLQAGRDGALEVIRADGTTYSKDVEQVVSYPNGGIECKTMQDGQYSCVGL
jgi:hypothetical protein